MNAIDSESNYVLAHLFVDKRTKQKCYEFLRQIKDTCYEQIIEIYNQEKHKKAKDRKLIEFVCDKFANYKSAFSRNFYRIANLSFGVPIACRKYHLEHNNNPIERYNGKINDRIKSIRGSFKKFEDAKCFMNLRLVIHNFINPNQQLKGETPAKMAGINLDFGRDKILGLARYLANEGNDD